MTRQKKINLAMIAANLVGSILLLTAGYCLVPRFMMLWACGVIVFSWLINSFVIVYSAGQNLQKNGMEDHV
jgi:hypothetical protein